ncbi:MAG TPA: DegT/DnrJ/EryC1/StrS family aminotransferase, partial [Bacteroidia bacterium]|nr:DegT/DnrJ/EryC1/StrS family aminotransferase [Bacteroidia bacterium]
VHDIVGVNSRLDTIQAAILKIKLQHLDEYATARNKAAAHYDKAFANNPKIKTPVRAKNSTHVFHQYTLQLAGVDRNKIKDQLAAKDIPSMIYYPIPVHKQKAYQSERNLSVNLVITEQLTPCVLSLPMHTELDEATLNYISSSLLELINA